MCTSKSGSGLVSFDIPHWRSSPWLPTLALRLSAYCGRLAPTVSPHRRDFCGWSASAACEIIGLLFSRGRLIVGELLRGRPRLEWLEVVFLASCMTQTLVGGGQGLSGGVWNVITLTRAICFAVVASKNCSVYPDSLTFYMRI